VVTWRVALGASALALTSCVAVLGIEDAEVDPQAPLGDPTGDGAGGSGTGGTGGAVADGGVDATPDAEQDPCEAYCNAVMETCTGARQVYSSLDACRGVCAALPRGAEGDEGVNTVWCRLESAGLAASTGEPDAYCASAGPGGAEGCGTNCDGYCAVMLATCASEFGSITACRAACEATPDLGGYDVSYKSGDSIQCRLYHASAATLDAEKHCPHAAGEAPCAPP
jgi:hypothetical protein